MTEASSRHPDLFQHDMPHDVRRELFGGKGVVRVWSLRDAPALPFRAVLACELEPGASVGTHLQEHFSEIVIGIAGSGSVLVNGSTSAFGPGLVVELPRGHTLAIANDSDSAPLRYLIIKARLS
jgi:quercetin dioxygenase-like cupin family protein